MGLVLVGNGVCHLYVELVLWGEQLYQQFHKSKSEVHFLEQTQKDSAGRDDGVVSSSSYDK